MGVYYYSAVKAMLTAERVEADLTRLAHELWPDGKYRVERIEGLPVTPKDDRLGMWCFMLDGEHRVAGMFDAAFSVVLCGDGRLEFKVPRTCWDEYWEDQQRVRRSLVRGYNRVA